VDLVQKDVLFLHMGIGSSRGRFFSSQSIRKTPFGEDVEFVERFLGRSIDGRFLGSRLPFLALTAYF
jgi:hypothetical protein